MLRTIPLARAARPCRAGPRGCQLRYTGRLERNGRRWPGRRRGSAQYVFGSASTVGRGVRRSFSDAWSTPANRGRSALFVRFSRSLSFERNSDAELRHRHQRTERRGGDLDHGRRLVGHDVRGPPASRQRRDLAEEVAGRHRRERAVAAVRLGRPGHGSSVEDEVGRVADLALADDRRPGRDLADRRRRDERVSLRIRDSAERRQVAGQAVEVGERRRPERDGSGRDRPGVAERRDGAEPVAGRARRPRAGSP